MEKDKPQESVSVLTTQGESDSIASKRRASQSVSCKQKLHRRDAQPFLFSSLSNAAAFTQFNYEPVSLGNSGAQEGLLMGNSPERSVVSPPSKKQLWCSEREVKRCFRLLKDD